MARPLNISIASGIQNWDASVSDNFTAIFDRPCPVPEVAGTVVGDIETAYPAANYAGCLATLNNGGVYSLYFSDGTTWLLK
jgi:hypothetical protein